MALLLDKGADIKRVDRFRRTALYYAAINAHEPAVKYLLSRGAETKIRDYEGTNPFQSAIDTITAGASDRIDDRLAALRALQGLYNVDARDDSGRTALMMAAERGSVPIIQYLLTLKPDINAKDRVGKTALDWADVKMRDAALAVLKAAGAVSGSE
jgi:ankyrin repeat protein